MSRILLTWSLVLSLCLTSSLAWTADGDTALRDQRREAQKERSELAGERRRELNAARTELREYAKGLQTQTKEQIRQLQTEFELERVDLRSQQETRVAEAEAEFLSKLQSTLGAGGSEAQIQQNLVELQEQTRTHAQQLFEIKEQSAEALHRKEMDNLREQHELLDELDRQVLKMADELGLTREPSPIIATPIGGELTEQEERWNERERKQVDRLAEQNSRLLAPYRRGGHLRQWERDNRQEDFELEWQEKRALNELEAMDTFYSLLITQGNADAQQDFMTRVAEAQKQRELVRIKFGKVRDRNRIERREQRRKLMQ